MSQGNKEKMIITSEALSPCSSLIRYIECQEYFSSTHFRLDAFSRLIPRKYKVCLVEFRTLNWHNFSSLPQSTESNLAKCANAKDNTVHWLVLRTVYLQCCQSGWNKNTQSTSVQAITRAPKLHHKHSLISSLY